MVKNILFDVDNTLVEHDQPVTLPAIELFENLKEIGFKTCIISNNKDYRVKPLADALESEYVYKAGKPSKTGYEKGMEIMGTNRRLLGVHASTSASASSWGSGFVYYSAKMKDVTKCPYLSL